MSTVFDINSFKSQISNTGFLQSNKYSVQITAGNQGAFVTNGSISTSLSSMASDLNYRCINALLPGIILRTADNNRFGTGTLEKMPFSAVYTDVDLTFLCDKHGNAYQFWYAWHNYIFASVGNATGKVVDQITAGGTQTTSGKRDFYTTQYKDNYTATISILVYDNFGNQALNYTLYNAFPVSVNDTPVGWGENDNILKLTTKITFREWAMNEGQTLLTTNQ